MEARYMTEETLKPIIVVKETTSQSLVDGIATIELEHVRGAPRAKLCCSLDYEGADTPNDYTTVQIQKQSLECLLVMITNVLKDMP